MPKFFRPAALLAVVATAAHAATHNVTPGYLTRVWQAENGLPHNKVTAIVQTPDGYLWLGTYGGLARFDGVRFAVFDNNSEPRLRRNRVTCLFEDAENNLWIGDELGGLSRLKSGQFEEMAVPKSWKGAKV